MTRTLLLLTYSLFIILVLLLPNSLGCSPTACKKCNPGNYCDECSLGYGFSYDNECISCSKGCSQCTTSTNCTTCLSGFVLSTTGECGKTQCTMSNCSICDDNECIQCKDGYYLDTEESNRCQKCGKDCLQCLDRYACQTCIQGKEVFMGMCIPSPIQTNCTANCQACDDQVCIQCKPGYWFEFEQTNTCRPCNSTCETCLLPKKCLTCKGNLTLNDNGHCVEGISYYLEDETEDITPITTPTITNTKK